MIAIKRILCPVDFSDFSRHALQHAVTLARWYEADVTVLNAYHISMPPVLLGGYPVPMGVPPVTTPPEELRAQALNQLTRFTEPFVASGVRLVLNVDADSPAHAILSTASSLPADLLVMGTHGHGGLDRLVLGSVTEKVLRKASCPVLTVPPPVSAELSNAPVLFERILCPIDFSDASMKAASYAVSLAEEADARLILLNVVEAMPEWDQQLYKRFDVAGFERALHEDASARLRTSVPDEARAWCKPEEIVVSGKPHQEILRLARERDIHVIVMGVHGRNPLNLMLFGSTTHHVVREAPCPVLTLRA